jgi:hypothetical protein
MDDCDFIMRHLNSLPGYYFIISVTGLQKMRQSGVCSYTGSWIFFTIWRGIKEITLRSMIKYKALFGPGTQSSRGTGGTIDMEKFMMNRFRFPFSQKPRLVLACLIVTTIISASFCLYYGMIHQEAWEQQIRYFQKNHEKNVATLNSVEQKINSYYHQLMSNADVVGIITKSDYGKDEYYTLSRIQADFLNIVSSDPVIDSIGLYSRNSGKVLSTHYMFSNLDYYPDHAIINRFYSQKISQKWFPSRDKRDGDGGSPRILSFVAGVPFNSLNGVIVFNINQKVLFSKLGLKPTGIIILDRQNKRICSQDGYINAVYQRNRDRLADIAREGREVVRVKDRNRNYYLFTTILNRSGWRVVSVVAESGIQAGIKSNLAGLYSILTVLILAIMGLAKLFQMNYAQSLRVYRDKLETNIEGLIDNTISGMLTGEYTQEEIIAKTAEFGIDLSRIKMPLPVWNWGRSSCCWR